MDKSELTRVALSGVFAKLGLGPVSRINLYDLHEAVRLRGASCSHRELKLMVDEFLIMGLIRDLTGGELNDATYLENLCIVPDKSVIVMRPGNSEGADGDADAGSSSDGERDLDWPEGRVSE